MDTHAQVRYVTGTTEMKLWKQSWTVQWKNSSRGKTREPYFTDDVKITPVDYYKFILRFGSLIFQDSLAFVTHHDKMVVNSVDPCCT